MKKFLISKMHTSELNCLMLTELRDYELLQFALSKRPRLSKKEINTLVYSIDYKNPQIVEFIVRKCKQIGSNIRLTMIYVAAEEGNCNLVKFLMTHKKISIRSRRFIMYYAISSCDLNTVKFLLSKFKGIHLDKHLDIYNALAGAVKNEKSLDLVKYFIETDTRVTIKNIMSNMEVCLPIMNYFMQYT